MHQLDWPEVEGASGPLLPLLSHRTDAHAQRNTHCTPTHPPVNWGCSIHCMHCNAALITQQCPHLDVEAEPQSWGAANATHSAHTPQTLPASKILPAGKQFALRVLLGFFAQHPVFFGGERLKADSVKGRPRWSCATCAAAPFTSLPGALVSTPHHPTDTHWEWT